MIAVFELQCEKFQGKEIRSTSTLDPNVKLPFSHTPLLPETSRGMLYSSLFFSSFIIIILIIDASYSHLSDISPGKRKRREADDGKSVKMKNLYALWGGIPRYVVEKAEIKSSQKLLEEAMATADFDKVIRNMTQKKM